MSKFLTPPVWYDKNGEENQSLVNAANAGVSGPTNIAFGLDAKSGTDNDSHSCIAIGYQATATGKNAIAIGSYDSDGQPVGLDAGTRATGSGTIVIGGGASATGGGIAIGDGASATANQIQLGNPNLRYDLKIGNGINGTVNGVDFSSVFKTVGAVKMASEAFTIYNKTSTENESNVVKFSGLEFTGKYLIVIRYAFKKQTTGGLITHEPEGSAFIIINQNYQENTVTYGGLSAGYTNGQMAFVFPKYTKTDKPTGTLQMQICSSTGNISGGDNIDIIMAYAILLDT